MGSSYESVLVAADVEAVCRELAALEQEALVAAVAVGRTGVVPGVGQYADAHDLAAELSRRLGAVAACWLVQDSDAVTATVYASGSAVHEYSSEQSVSASIDVFEDSDGLFKARIGAQVYPMDRAPIPRGPAGARPEAFRPLGSDRADPAQLERALRGGPHERDTPWLFAEQQHRLIIEALGLDPRLITGDFDPDRGAEIPGVRHVCARRPEDDFWAVPDPE